MTIFGLATSYLFPFRIVQIQLHKSFLNTLVQYSGVRTRVSQNSQEVILGACNSNLRERKTGLEDHVNTEL